LKPVLVFITHPLHRVQRSNSNLEVMFAFHLLKYSLYFDEIWYLEEVGDIMLKVVNNISLVTIDLVVLLLYV
jgi:hypothetical protein